MIAILLFLIPALCVAEINKNPKETVYVAANIAGGLGLGYLEPSHPFAKKTPYLKGTGVTASKDWAWSAFAGGFGRAFGSERFVCGFGLAYYSGFSLKGEIRDARFKKSNKYAKLSYILEGIHGPGIYLSAGTACNNDRDTVHLMLGLAKRGARLTLKNPHETWESDVAAPGWLLAIRYIKPVYFFTIPISFVFSYEAHGFIGSKIFKSAINKKAGSVTGLPLGGKLNGFATEHSLSFGILYAF